MGAQRECTRHLLTARNVLTAVGTPPQGPTFIATDNKAHMLVANSAGSSVRSRHFLKKYTIMQERLERKEITVGNVKDAQNPADFLTKSDLPSGCRRTSSRLRWLTPRTRLLMFRSEPSDSAFEISLPYS